MVYLYGILSVILFVCGFYQIFAVEQYETAAVLLLAGSAAAWGSWRAQLRSGGRLQLSLREPEHRPEGYLPESFTKAVTDFNYIQTTLPAVQNTEIAGQYRSMQHVSRNMLVYLEKHPEKLPLARRFIDYYQDRAVELLKGYMELEASGVSRESVRAATERLKEGLEGFDRAYEEQFARLLSDHIDNMDAELRVARQMMESDGIDTEAEASHTKQDYGGTYHTQTVETRDEYTRTSVREPWQKKSTGHQVPQKKASFLERFFGSRAVPPQLTMDVRQKKYIAAALAIMFGSFGAHNFYLGKTFKGIVYIALCWTFIPGLLGFIEGIRYLFMPMDDFYVDYYLK